ncbi:MAG: mechanosensitive ion channel [Ruminococcus sp.]|nr:mechanosensitive ion channel [Ruminococcus sp.]
MTSSTSVISEIITDTVISATDETTAVTTQSAISEQVSRTAGLLEKALDHFGRALPTLIMAFAILTVGVIIVRLLSRFIKRSLNKTNIDSAAKNFLLSLIRITLYTIVIIMALTALNVPMSSIITVFGAAGLAISLALQSCLSNLAGGFIILFSKPFSAGDTIELDGSVGNVKTISILYTKIETFDGKIVSIPNGKVSEAKIINYTESPNRRVDLQFDISYDTDFRTARKLITDIITSDKLILNDPEPIVRMSAHNESSVSIDVRVWTANDNYSTVRYGLIESVKEGFDKNGIEIPFNQLDLNIKRKK